MTWSATGRYNPGQHSGRYNQPPLTEVAIVTLGNPNVAEPRDGDRGKLTHLNINNAALTR